MVLIGLLIALAAAGFEVGQLAIVVGALGVGIGFGLQNVVNNFVSGLILMFERPIQPGDVVEITGTTGTVREIGMRATTLTTGDGADVDHAERHAAVREAHQLDAARHRTGASTSTSASRTAATRGRCIELLKKVTADHRRVSLEPAPAVLSDGLRSELARLRHPCLDQ